MANADVFTQDEKSIVLDALNLKRASLQRAVNAQPSGSRLAKAILEDMAAVDTLTTKVGLL